MHPHTFFKLYLSLFDKSKFMPALLDWLESEGYEVSKQTPDPPAKGQQEFDWIMEGI